MSNDKLEDFGEHIAGSKKELHKGFIAHNLSDAETRKLPLSKLWSIKEIDSIEDKGVAAIAHVLRESIGTKPRQAHKLERWFNQLAQSQAIVRTLIDSDNPTEIAQSIISQGQKGSSKDWDKIYLLTKLDRENWKFVTNLSIGQKYGEDGYQYSISFNGAVNQKYENIDVSSDESLISHPLTDEALKIRQNIIDTYSESFNKGLVEAVEKLKGEDLTSRNGLSVSSFEPLKRRSTGEIFIAAKADRTQSPIIGGFSEWQEAKDYLRDNLDDVIKKYQDFKEYNTIQKRDMRTNINEERVGISYRDHDITPEEFMETFNIRGGQFGNWVNQEERTEMLNRAYDGFMDLSRALQVEPKAIGLNGRLGIAFGARGSGTANAHYETEEKVINLTKTRGAGSLAHEWWHALDHYTSSTVNLTTSNFKTWATAQGNKLQANLQTEEMNNSIKDLVESIKKSELNKRSEKADSHRSGGAYFSQMKEMTARAFEAYVANELKNQGIKNDFLVNIAKFENWQKNPATYPYPTESELVHLSEKYANIVQELKNHDQNFEHKEYNDSEIIHHFGGSIQDKPALNIILKDFKDDEQSQEVQARVVAEAQSNPQALINAYKDIQDTFNGRYIASDMMKEVFEDFNKSSDNRNRFNNAVHNASAALAAEHFRQMLDEPIQDGRDTVIFLTGSPGAGKTSSVMNNGELDVNTKIVFEGQLANAHQNNATMDKIQQAIDNDLRVKIIAVNPLPEQALENTFKRYYDPADGRGAPISTMARIQGNTYDGLKAIYDRFGDDIELNIIDKPNGNENSIKYIGWQHLDVLKSQGTEQEINERLKTHLLNHYTRGEIDYECFKQSAGSDERARQIISSMARPNNRGTQENGNRREISSAGSSQSNQPQHSSRNQSVGRETQSLTSSTSITKTYLYTTPEDINQLQELKAQGVVAFDIAHKVWYAKEADNPAVKQWLNRPNIPTPQESFADYLKANGVAVVGEHPILDGRAHRISNEGSTDKNVVYQFYHNDGGVPAASITNFSRGGTPEKWVYPVEHLNTLKNIEAVEIAKGSGYKTQSIVTPSQTQAQIQHDNDKQALQDKAAERAKMVMDFTPKATNHDYLARKQVTGNDILRVVPDKSELPAQYAKDIVIANDWREANALRQNNPDGKLILQKGSLIVPQFDNKGELRAFETIGYNGSKYAQKDAQKQGLALTLGKIEDGKPILIAEGYATAATLHEKTGRTTIVAFGKGGLADVAESIRKDNPSSRIYICADNDHSKSLENDPVTDKPKENAGLMSAQKAAEIANAHVLVPQFNASDKGKDWNDVFVDKGIDEFKTQLREQLAKINTPTKQANSTHDIAQNNVESNPTNQLDVVAIKEKYPKISDDNLRSIEAWKNVISQYSSKEVRDNLMQRLENKLPSLANGETLPMPKPEQMTKTQEVEQQGVGKPQMKTEIDRE